jgi:hypothetical protein
MAELEFFATWEEIGELVQWLLDRQCEFIPDLHYPSSSFDRITDLPTLQSLSRSTPRFYIVREDLIESPLKLREVSTTEKHFFYIEQRTGGPTLDLYWGRQFERDGCPHLSATELSYDSWYESSITGAREKPSKAFRNLYGAAARTVRVSRRRIKPGVREFWISPALGELVRSGWILVGLEDFSIDQILGTPSG